VLAKGLIRGGTGDTPRIMKAAKVRGAQLTDADTAGLDAVVDISEPTLLRIRGVGPVGKPAASVEVSSTQWVIPGRDIVGDGIVLSFPGLVVEPAAALEPDGMIHLQAKVSPMCGCPIEAGGMWDAANYNVRATVLHRGKRFAETSLAFTGRTGEYAGTLQKPADGRYSVRFVATDAKTSNAGVVVQALKVGR